VARRTLFLFVGLSLLPAAVPAPAGEEASPPLSGETPAEQEASGAEAVALSLREVLTAALENNLDILVRRYDPLKSEASVTLQTSRFDPFFSGSGSSSRFTQPQTSSFLRSDISHDFIVAFEDPLVLGGKYKLEVKASDNRSVTFFRPGGEPEFNTSWAVSFTQPILRNLGPYANRWQIVVARNNLGVSESQFRQTVIDTLAAAEKAYWDLNFALMDLETKRASLQLAKDFLEQNRIKVRVGTLAPIEITQAEAGVADREEGVIVAENVLRTAEDALRRIMNVPAESALWLGAIRPSDAPPLQEVVPSMDEAVQTAGSQRPDIEQARLNVRSKETELSYRRNQRRWGLDFEGSYGALGFDADLPGFTSGGSYHGSFDDLLDRDTTTWRLTFNMTVPVGNRPALANFLAAEHALSQAQYDLERLEQAARIEVRNAVRKVETDLKRVKASQVNVRLQREKLAAEQKKFDNGMSTAFQVLQFQTDLATAETRENQAIVDYNKSLVELERVKGTLLEAREMLMPRKDGEGGERESAGGGSGRSAALRRLWDRAGDGLPWNAAAWAAYGATDRVLLPTGFVFDGRRLIGRIPAVPGGS
jgi:outer membrane protein TolC